jgi:hypothetical protein
MNATAKGNPNLTKESFDLMSGLVGKKAALMTMDLMTEESKLRYRSFYPCGDMLIGLRYAEPQPGKVGFKPGRSQKIINGQIVSEPRTDVQFTPPLVPHHAEHVYGFWHINDQQEMVMNLKLGDDRRLTVLIEGYPERGRIDRFAWFCLECLNPLYMAQLETAKVGLSGYYAVQEDAFEVFNNDESVRTCSECGTVHPVAYSIFPWKDTEAEREARALW